MSPSEWQLHEALRVLRCLIEAPVQDPHMPRAEWERKLEYVMACFQRAQDLEKG